MRWFGFGRRGRSEADEDQERGDADQARIPTKRNSEPLGAPLAAATISDAASQRVDSKQIAPVAGVTEEEAPPPPAADQAKEGYIGRFKAVVTGSVDTARRSPETLEEAFAVLRGQRDVKPDFERAAYTVSAALVGGCVHGWLNSASAASKFPSHQRTLYRLRAGGARGIKYAAFALIFEGSTAALEALRRKRDFLGGAVGGGLAGMAHGVSGGLASTRRGLLYGVWMGALFGWFRNHVAAVREQASIAREEKRLEEEEREASGKVALQKSIAALNAQLEAWPKADGDDYRRGPRSPR